MKKLILTIVLCVVFSASLSAQEKEQFKFGVAAVPQYAFASTMRVDFDITVKHKNVITIAPMFSLARHSSLLFLEDNYSYDYAYDYYDDDYPKDVSLIGGGLKVTWRHFFGDFHRNTGLYAGVGLHYRYSHVEYTVNSWMEIEKNGNQYITYGSAAKEDNFNQGGFDFICGYQMYFFDNLYGDLFGGWGFRISDYNEKGSNNHWGETIFDFAYSGYTPLIGLRLGVFF